MSRTSLYNQLKNEKSFLIIVKTNAQKTILKTYDEEKNAYLLDVAAPPENNKANQEIIKYLSRITRKDVKIKSGLKSKKKIISLS